ncbi:hypothetical protein MD484_g4717, partial [Candolleomyces efflorescens]
MPPPTTRKERERLLRNLLSQELGTAISLTDSAWAKSLFVDLAPESMIESFLEQSSEHQSGRWTRIPEVLTRKSQLRESLRDIINSIIGYFLPEETRTTRKAVNFKVGPLHFESADSFITPSPSSDIAIMASGPSFSTPRAAPLGFSNIAACVTVGLTERQTDETDQVALMAAYAKHIFIQQPNRNFVRSISITGRNARLFQFDRSGAQYSPTFDIHDDPHTFIRLILGLSSLDERVLGLDDTIQWTLGPDGRKVGGTLRTVSLDNSVITYELVMSQGPFARTSLCGRGTTCWVVKAANGEKFIVKDYWVAGGRPSESNLLREVNGLPGICQVVSFEDDRMRTEHFREPVTTQDDTFKNRTKIRIVMKAYGPSIENFTSVTQLLSALRDAIAAHKSLLDRNIIHRDISPNNILLGVDDEGEGDRGVLIDLDIALKTLGLASNTPVDFEIGTRMFQSLMVLRSWLLTPAETPVYDYLDDLEAFFWVFAYILLVYTPEGHRMPPNRFRECLLAAWNDDPATAHTHKWTFMDSLSIAYETQHAIHPGWNGACWDLFLTLRKFVHEISDEKERLVFQVPKEDGVAESDRFASLLAKVDEHYARVLEMFDTALKKVEAKKSESLSPPKDSDSSTSSSKSSTSERITSPDTSATSNPAAAEGGLAPTEKPETPAEQPVTHTRSSKRRHDEAELDEVSVELKRRCPPSRRAVRSILGSVYSFCRGWF